MHEAQLRILTAVLIFAAIVLAGLLSLLVNTMLSRVLAARELADQRRQRALGELESMNRRLSAQAQEMEEQTVEPSVTREAAEHASERVVNVLDTMSDAFISFDREWTIGQLKCESDQAHARCGGSSIVGRNCSGSCGANGWRARARGKAP